MIFLGKEEIEKLVDPNEIMDQIEEAYRIFGADAYYMPPRPVIEHENKTLIYMPCFTEDVIGTKMLTIFPENAKLGLPSLDGLVILNDRTTGRHWPSWTARLSLPGGRGLWAVWGSATCPGRTPAQWASWGPEPRAFTRLCTPARPGISRLSTSGTTATGT